MVRLSAADFFARSRSPQRLRHEATATARRLREHGARERCPPRRFHARAFESASNGRPRTGSSGLSRAIDVRRARTCGLPGVPGVDLRTDSGKRAPSPPRGWQKSALNRQSTVYFVPIPADRPETKFRQSSTSDAFFLPYWAPGRVMTVPGEIPGFGKGLPPNLTEAESFLDEVDDVSRLIEGLHSGKISPEYVDKKIKQPLTRRSPEPRRRPRRRRMRLRGRSTRTCPTRRSWR